MKKNVLALSITAALGLAAVGSANALTYPVLAGATPASSLILGETGVGHSLFVPYFSTQDKNTTLINLVNTDTVNAKAVKVRFRGAANSDDLFDFQVFLSPGDVWTASLSQGADGFTRLTTNDNSCTKPAKAVLNATSFLTTRLDAANLAGDALAAGTREGYVEIFNMADIPSGWMNGAAVTNATAQTGEMAVYTAVNNASGGQGFTGAVASNVNALFGAVKHVAGVAPCAMATSALGTGNAFTAFDGTDITAFVAAGAASGAASDNQAYGMIPPTGGLFANWTIINVVGAAAWSGEATAIRAVTAAVAPSTVPVAAAGNLIYWPQTGSVATAANRDNYTADPLLRPSNAFRSADAANLGTVAAGAAITALNVDLPDMSTPYTAAAPAGALGPLGQTVSLTAALQTRSISNEYLTDPTISATTDWVFSMPTRRYSTAFAYGATISTTAGASFDDGRRFADLTGAVVAGAAAPLTIGWFLPANTTVNQASATNVNGRQICVTGITRRPWDREETTTTASTAVIVSPAPVTPTVAFCGETSVISFNNGGTARPSGSLKATVSRTDYTVPYTDGWMMMATPPAAVTAFGVGAPLAAATAPLTGLPVVGSSMVRAVGGTGTFGATYNHRYAR